MRLGILRNPASTGNRRRRPTPLPPGAEIAETGPDGGCAAALARLREAGAEAIVIDGGDGAVQAAVSALPEAWAPAPPPPVAILPNGATNLVARRLGGLRGARGLAALAREDAAQVARRAREAPLLRLELGRGAGPLRGFIAGWGVYAEATRIAREEIPGAGGRRVLAAAGAALRRSLRGPEAARLREGVRADLRLDGAPAPAGPRFLGLVTTLPGRLMLGLEPFWGDGAGALRWLDVEAPPARLAWAAPRAAFGRPAGWMAAAGYRSGRAERLELRLATPLILDGEEIAPPGNGAIALSGAERLRVIPG